MTAPARTTRGRARHHRPRRCPSCGYTPAQGIACTTGIFGKIYLFKNNTDSAGNTRIAEEV
ncbi:hypothetical protein [Kribbella sp. NPDC051620]|uniref:hypothetical protein n=1 Tax=Kribbella sp. NPDC051620 TaxID=3364120 RepID=UPI003796825B